MLLGFGLTPFIAFCAGPVPLSGLKCASLECESSDGGPAGMATIEAVGSFPQHSGTALTLALLKRKSSQVVLERKVGVMSDGRATISLPLGKLEEGDYLFALFARGETKKPLAGGVFHMGGSQAPADVARPEPPANRNSGGNVFAGEWRGINGTAGLLAISPNGTYTFNGAKGTYRAAGNEIVFSGPLKAWNDGKARLREGVIEFVWQRGDMMWNQFHFARVK
jgi:hypothetical protein